MIMLKIKNNESSVSLVSKDKIPVWLECCQSWSVEPPPCRTSLAPVWSRLYGWPKWSKDYHNDVEGADKHCLLWAPWWETAPTSQSQVAKVVWMSIYKPVADVPQRNKHIRIKVVQKLSKSCPKVFQKLMLTSLNCQLKSYPSFLVPRSDGWTRTGTSANLTLFQPFQATNEP